MSQLISPSVGDWVQVQIKRRRYTKEREVVSVISGVIVDYDDRTFGFDQFKLDNGMWFSPQSDMILKHKTAGAYDEREPHVDR